MQIGVIGDLHFKEALGYAEYIADRRVAEREEVFDTIIDSLKDSDAVVLMGDQLNSRSNHADTIKRFVAFLERFGDKELFIIGGNHEKWGDGRSSIDFLREIKGKNWHVITDRTEVHTICGKRCVFLPFMTGPELGKKHEDGWDVVSRQLAEGLPSGDILFGHHAIADTLSNGVETNTFQEVVLPKDVLLRKFQTSIVGHIHSPGTYESGRIILTGSIFNDVVGECGKFIWKVKDDCNVSSEAIPGRKIVKVENPTADTLSSLLFSKGADIVKVVLTSEHVNLAEIRPLLEKFDGHILVDSIRKERRDIPSEDIEDLSIEGLLRLFAKSKNVDESLLMEGYEMVK